MSQQQDLVHFLSESAQEAAVGGRHDEAEELLTLRARVLARQFNLSQLQLPLETKEAA
jgi:hypothetical protein